LHVTCWARLQHGVSRDRREPAERTSDHTSARGPQVSNPCDQALQVLLLTFDDVFIVIGVAPGVEATTSTADLGDVGLRLFPVAGVGGVNSSSPDPCAFSPDFVLNQDGTLSPATC
jgi:hypothetical protein